MDQGRIGACTDPRRWFVVWEPKTFLGTDVDSACTARRAGSRR